MTLVEITISGVILAIALLAFLASLIAGMQLDRNTHERTLAMNAAREILEKMRATADFQEIYIRYNNDTSDDPGAGSPGPNFTVAGLNPQSADPDGQVGRILLPGDFEDPGHFQGYSYSSDLYESSWDLPLGMPRDLDGNGSMGDGNPHDTDYIVLPVRILVKWEGTGGKNDYYELITFLSPK